MFPAAGGRVGIGLPRFEVEGPEPLARLVADRVLHAGEPQPGAKPELLRAVARWRPPFEPEPAFALWFVRSERIDRFLKPLYPSPPLRGALEFVRTGGWIVFRMQLAFSDAATAEKAVVQTRDGIIAAMASGRYPRMDWKAALEPLTVHPEGAILWVQWSLPESRALDLWNRLW